MYDRILDLKKALSQKSHFLFGLGATGKSWLVRHQLPQARYNNRSEAMTYWRTVGGQFEVDCIVGSEIAVEIKGADRVTDRMLTGLKALQEEKVVKRHILVSRDPEARSVGGIQLMPVQTFLDRLWKHSLI